MKSIGTKELVIILVATLSGAVSIVLCKMAYEYHSADISNEEERPFRKPIAMVAVLFFSMMAALPLSKFHCLLGGDTNYSGVSAKTFCALLIPTIFDLLSSILFFTAQLFMTASVWQLLRCGVICVNVMLKYLVLGNEISSHMRAGVSIITVSVVWTILFSILSVNERERTSFVQGVVWIGLGCIFQGLQCMLSLISSVLSFLILTLLSVVFWVDHPHI